MYGCGGAPSLYTGTAALGTLTGLTVSPASVRVFNGTTARYTATAAYSDGSTQDVTSLATWSSSATSVATVNAQGIATAVSTYGKTNIKATYGGFNASGTLSAASFGAPVSYAHNPDLPVALVAADFDRDGKLDIATANANYGYFSIGVYYNSNGAFPTESSYGTCGQPMAIIAGDLNGDGYPDIVAVCPSNNQIAVHLSPNFQRPTLYRVGSNPTSVAIGDFNGDGRPDLAVTNNASSGSISILLNAGNGAFGAQTAFPVSSATAVAVADFNSDGWLDLAVTNYNAGTIGIMSGNGDGTFNPPTYFATGSGLYPSPNRLVVGDYNGDGAPDLAVADQGGTVSLLLNSLGAFPSHTEYAAGGEPMSVAIADLNGDGRLDFVDVTNASAKVTIGMGNGNGTFQTPFSYSVSQAMNDVIVADFNGDAHPDIAFVNAGLQVMFQN